MPEISGGNILLNTKEILSRVGLTAGMKAADLGCGGAGHFVMPAARIVGDDGVVYAVDILKTVLASIESIARLENLNNIQTVWTNLEKVGATKIEADSLDVAFLINVLFQVDKLDEVVKEAVRLIKPSGKLLVIDWKTSGAPFGPPADKRLSADKVKQAAQKLNLKQLEEFEAGPYHWGLVFQKG